MKNAVLLLSAILCAESYSQTTAYTIQRDLAPSVSLKKISESTDIAGITPDFKRNFVIPYHDMMKLDELIKNSRYAPTYVLRDAENPAPELDTYLQFISIVSSAVVVTNDGNITTLRSGGGHLSADQKKLLESVMPGSLVTLQIAFIYKHDRTSDTIHGNYRVRILPDQPTEFPGGAEQLTHFLNRQFLARIKSGGTVPRQSAITFLVDEQGQVHTPRITRSSGREDVDQLLKEAAACMPDWRSATDRGQKVKQEVTLVFGYSGGC